MYNTKKLHHLVQMKPFLMLLFIACKRIYTIEKGAVAEAEYFELKPGVGAEIEVGYLNHLKHNALITGIVESKLEKNYSNICSNMHIRNRNLEFHNLFGIKNRTKQSNSLFHKRIGAINWCIFCRLPQWVKHKLFHISFAEQKKTKILKY
ncbi:hypothetical protein BpHYR1_012333 [Brachionus plicatilis]|uniref:Uncharacterized protein n=1 Tax=Brachionus plicatilis TaxID=10195 RepID=A0A3M7RQ05_BRAPC|nr:hypothetical protein BpHYR1_012333 [Brachionus plicatilis]